MNLSSLLTDHPFTGTTELLFDDESTWTADGARAAVDTLAAELADATIQPGEAVAIDRQGGDMIIAMIAVWAAGGVVVPINDRLPPSAVAMLLADTDASIVVDANGARRRREGKRHDAGAAFVLFTSGTTGRPKAIVHHHDAYLEIIDRVLGPLSRDRDVARTPSPNLIPVPMALNAGIYNALFGLRAGAPLVVMRRFSTALFAELVRRHGIRSTVLPPASIAMLNDDESINDLGDLRYVRSITAPLSPFQARRFTERFGVAVLNGYGQAELGEVIGWTAADVKAHPEKVGAVGRPHPGVEVRLDAPDNNGVGELLIKPPVPPEAGVVATLGDRLGSDGFVRTGDLARIDDGFVWIEGRVGDLINRGGNKVFPAEVEEVLVAVAGVAEAAVIGRPDERLGEVPVAFVVGEATADDMTAACRAELAPYKIPAAYRFVEALPRNDAGKVLRGELREALG